MKLVTKLILALATAGLPAAHAGAAAPPPRPTPVRLVAWQPASAERWVAASVQAARRATIATRISAQVREVLVREGGAVKAGQALVRLADADVRGQLAAAEAALASASAHERRIGALLAERAATPSELEMAVAQRAQAEAAVQGARTTLEYAELRAPFAGTVQARRVEPGDLVGPGQPLLVLEGSALELAASLSEEEARGLAVGRRVRFEAEGVGGEAEVTALTPGGDPVSHRRGLKARILGDPGLRSGAFARIAVSGKGRDGGGAWVPRSALVERGDLTGVFVAANGKAELRWISVGEPLGDRVAVRAGLSDGERVIDRPGALRDGDEVEVRP
ncbi:MAG TPA: efflux RND transporter periplasmic adaptor subunit [Anaeromyxobacteraceae bacterium]|nr:efflux RND transporter periplasmic adaptor subunit [Anaeromyxobacteraceae bacterium]